MNASRILARRIRSRTQTQTRSFGAGQPPSQSQSARLWEGHTTHKEGWETTIYATYAASTLLITLALGFAPDTSIQTWASNEAEVRLGMEGKTSVVFGEHYNTPEKVFGQVWDDFMLRAMNPEDDDDDDDDDDDEEDDDEEEDEEEDDEE